MVGAEALSSGVVWLYHHAMLFFRFIFLFISHKFLRSFLLILTIAF